MMKQLIAGLLCGALATTGCASSGMRVAQAPQPATIDQQVLRDYVQRLPAGSRVRVEEANGRSFRGTLMRATDTAVVVQKNTRVPEPPVEVPLARVARITLDAGSGGSTGKAVAIGIAAGVGGVLAFFAILTATFND